MQNEILHRDNDPQRALLTLEQLSQTLESMTGVVERLRHHLNQQLQEAMGEEAQQQQQEMAETAEKRSSRDQRVLH